MTGFLVGHVYIVAWPQCLFMQYYVIIHNSIKLFFFFFFFFFFCSCCFSISSNQYYFLVRVRVFRKLFSSVTEGFFEKIFALIFF